MRPRILLLTAVLPCLLLLGWALPQISAQQQPPIDPNAVAQPPEESGQLVLELSRRARGQKLKLAFPAFRGTNQLSGEAARAARELEETVRRDLDYSGYFEI